MSFSGSLSTYRLADLLEWVEHHSSDGRLILERKRDRRVIDLIGGKVVYASSSLPRERLGTFLAERNLVDRETMFRLMALNYASGENLTTLLLEEGTLDSRALAAAAAELAEAIVFDSFSWLDGEFTFDPDFRPRQVLPIQLSLQAQLLAFRGAKNLDDTARRRARRRRRAARRDDETSIERIEGEEDVAFWRVLERSGEDDLDHAEVRERLAAFRAFMETARRYGRRPPRPFAVFNEVASLIRPRLEESRVSEDFLLQVAALDPYLALDLLLLGNSLTTDRGYGFPTPRDAVAACGLTAAEVLLDHVTREETASRSADSPLELAGWRACLGFAVTAAELGPHLDIDKEEAYYLGLLSGLGYLDLLSVALEVGLPSRRFLAATLDELQSAAGRMLADRFALPSMLTEVLCCDGRVVEDSPAHLHLLYLARAFSPAGDLGSAWRLAGMAREDLVARYELPPELAERISSACAQVFGFLGLPL